MRKFIIDTDTASDDAIAIIMALREKKVHIEAITVVAGNVPVEQGVKNALVAVEMGKTYAPPVYKGMDKPLLKQQQTAECVHGKDGFGNMNLSDSSLKVENEHAIDALIRIIEKHKNQEFELIALGPLTNIAMACLRAPEVMKKLKRVIIMGGAGKGSGNVTPVAEFNIHADAEAAQVVINTNLNLYFIGWDACLGNAFINRKDLQYLENSESEIANFCARCTKSLAEFSLDRFKKDGVDLADPATVAAAFYDEMTNNYRAFCYVDYKSEDSYGNLIIDYLNVNQNKANAEFCENLNGELFKQKLFELIM